MDESTDILIDILNTESYSTTRDVEFRILVRALKRILQNQVEIFDKLGN